MLNISKDSKIQTKTKQLQLVNRMMNSYHSKDKTLEKDKKVSNYLCIYCMEDGEVQNIINDIRGIRTICGEQAFKEFFNLSDVTELADCEDLDFFVRSIAFMIDDIFEDEITDELIMIFYNEETDQPMYGIHFLYEYDEEIGDVIPVFNLVAFGDEDTEDGFDDGDECGHCEHECSFFFEFEED